MKRISMLYVLLLGGVSLLPGLFLFRMNIEMPGAVVLYILVSVLVGMFVFKIGGNIIIDKQYEKWTERLAQDGFLPENSFRSLEAMLWIDIEAGRLAVLPRYAPFRPILFTALAIQRVETVMLEDVFGATKRVSFQFAALESVVEIPTLSSPRKSIPVQGELVQNAISKADAYCVLLLKAKQNAKNTEAE